MRHMKFVGAGLTLMLGLAAGLAAAQPDPAEAVPAKALDGKDLFKISCKVCHGAKAAAGEYTPMTLIQEQWEEFFDEIYIEVHGEIPCPTDERMKVSDTIDGPKLEAIRKFCVDHAADSEQPMTCG